MIRNIAITKDMLLKEDVPLDQLKSDEIEWYWVDFENPTREENELLNTVFNFHELSIEDCINDLQRPKIDRYEDHFFVVMNSLEKERIYDNEVDAFIGKNFIVTYHRELENSISRIMSRIENNQSVWDDGSLYVFYRILDQLVDNYFEWAYELEDRVMGIEDHAKNAQETGIKKKYKKDTTEKLMDRLFKVRTDLFKLKRTFSQMQDLVYRIMSLEELKVGAEKNIYFSDVYDHLLRLNEIIESCFEMTCEKRDSYVARNSYKMNRIVMRLTVITMIFVPLTFLASVYGMNFSYMPLLSAQNGFFYIGGMMMIMTLIMYFVFKKLGWFNVD